MSLTWKAWTVKEIRELRICVAQGSTYSEIAEFLGRTYSSVQSKCRELGIHCRTKCPHDIGVRVRILALLGAGLNGVRIGRELDLDRSWVSRIISEFVRGGIVTVSGATCNRTYHVVTNDHELFQET